ncbi:SDR family NAD(P)-dependent oxidoreductase [Streptomyces sp. NPDC052101]|uniref:SDR family NAD(P)-dependent oxidoreductase n=1 Tax=Streptomyces sp. NPDC052101 TaxID=3155763 RepID=UPI003416631B
MFPGQGSQWVGMAAELLGCSSVFAGSAERCAEALAEFVEWDVLAVLRGEEGAASLERVDVVQPALWAVMVSLAALWRSLGVEPSAVVGHSQGEIAAACVSGALSLRDGARLVALRSQVIAKELAGRGGMVSVAAPVARVEELIAGRAGVWVAVVNGPGATVVAGDTDALAEVVADVEAAGIRARTIPVDYASHTPHVEQVRDQLLELAAAVSPRPGAVPMHSTVTGEEADGTELNAEYWYRNLREPVRFAQTVQALIAAGSSVFVEVSPHPVLAGAVGDAAGESGTDLVSVGTLRRDQGGVAPILTSLAELWVRGVEVDWTAVVGDGGRVDLPTYAFQRERYWLDAATPGTLAGSTDDAGFWDIVEREDLEGLARTLRLDDRHTELAALLPALSAWHRRHSAASTMDSWRYRVTWKPLTSTAPPTLVGTWLVAIGRDQMGCELYEAVAAALRRHGASVEPLVAPDGEDRWTEALLEHPDPVGVVSLLAQDEAAMPDAHAVPAGFGRTLLLTQALEAAGVSAPLWSVTQGAVSMGAGDPVGDPARALVWGFGRVAAQELPAHWGGLVDLPIEPDDAATDRMCAVIAGQGDEDQVVVRSSGVFGRRIVRAPIGDGFDGWTPGKGTVLITGGTGALGGQVARRLAAQGAEHLLLVSRRGTEAPGAAELEADLAATGARVTVAACDIADPDRLRDLVAAIPDEYPLTGVIHTAAVLDDRAITSLTLEQAGRVLRVKAEAAWNLHELTQDMELTAFVLFSSLAGTFGMAGQGNYAPANAYLDALAQYRRARGLTATSVAWGSWAQGGMAEQDGANDVRLRHGIPLLPPETAVQALEAALAHDDASVVIADIDWDRFTHAYTATRPSRLLDELPEVQKVRTAVAPTEAATSVRERLAGLEPQERDRQVRDAVRTQVAAVLGHGSPEAIEVRRPFLELGLDSVTAVELRNRLNTTTGLRLSATVIFDHPSVAELAGFIGTELFGDTDDDPVVAAAAELDRLEGLLAAIPDGDLAKTELTGRLRSLVRTTTGVDQTETGAVEAEDLEAATDDEIFDYIEKQFGIS